MRALNDIMPTADLNDSLDCVESNHFCSFFGPENFHVMSSGFSRQRSAVCINRSGSANKRPFSGISFEVTSRL